MNTYRDQKKDGLKAKLAGIELRLSLLRALMLGLLCIFLLIWAFFIGVLVGRGEKPENMVPEIAALMPSQNGTASPADDPDNMQIPEDKIIQPENLEFMGNLKTKPTNDDLTEAPLATNIPPKLTKPPTEDSKPAAASNPKTEAEAKPQAQSHPQTQGAVEVAPGVDVFDYVYQVAASGDKNGADGLKNKLLANGMDAFVLEAQKDGGAIYRINVRFRGTPDDTKKLTKALQDVGIERKILITKTPTVN